MFLCFYKSELNLLNICTNADLSTHVKKKKKKPLSLFAHGNHIAIGKEIEVYLVSGVF